MSSFKFAHIDRSKKLQTQLSTALIVSLMGRSIVFYLYHTISEIFYEFFKRTKITKTIEIYHMIVSLCVCSIDEIGYFTFSSDVIPPSEARPNSIFIFDDVA